MFKLDFLDFGRRMAVEREIDSTAAAPVRYCYSCAAARCAPWAAAPWIRQSPRHTHTGTCRATDDGHLSCN